MGFEQVREQLDKIESTPQEAPQTDNETPQQSEQLTKAEQKILDLDSLDRVSLGGKEWTLKDLKNSILMHQDYTKKTQNLAQERQRLEEQSKFDLNLRYDLQAVLDNPQLANDFKKIYPKQYHDLLDKYLSLNQQPQENAPQQPAIPKEFLSRVESIESKFFEKEVEAETAKIDSIIEKYSKQFDMADVDLVLAKAQALSEKGTKLDEKGWEQIFKTTHEALETRFKEKYSKEFKKQQDVSSKSKDIPPGGGIPGQAPVMPRTLREAKDAMIESLTNRK
jgi:hypothetical protein